MADEVADDSTIEEVHLLACEVDDIPAEYLAAAADRLRADGALDVVLQPVVMKKGRAGTRIEVLVLAADQHAKADQDYTDVSRLLQENTELTRAIHQLTKEVHERLFGGSPSTEIQQ